MKKQIYLLILITFGFFACEGPIGPPGPPGLDGIDGLDGEEAFAFEYEVDFGADTDYSAFLPLPDNFTMLESDVMLVYLLWEVDDDQNEIWRPLPQSIFSELGLFIYDFDFTTLDARVFLKAEFDPSLLSDGDLLNQIFRVVVVPSQFLNGGRHNIDLTDYEQVAEALDLKDMPTHKNRKYNRTPGR